MTQLTITDMFCGAGGSSTGATMVPGIEVAIAMNHWARAIETHNTNHPDALHIEKDISQYDPRKIFTTDILWASPSCTNHSVAKGKKRVTHQGALFGEQVDEAADRSRATMWDVVRYAEEHDYKLIFTENVVDAARWLFFDQWLGCMHALGYEHHIVYMNSMHAQLGGLPAPQSRDRMYVVFWKKGNQRPNFDRLRPKAHCPEHGMVDALQVFKKAERWGRYRAQYNFRCPHTSCKNAVVEPGWLPAAQAIDWSIQGQRIGDRDKPLSPKTMARIQAGLDKYGTKELQLEAAGNQYDAADPKHPQFGQGSGYMRIWPTDEPLRTLHTSPSKGLLIPVEGRVGKEAASVMTPIRTQTTRNETGLLIPYYGTNNSATTNEPLRTVTAIDRFAMITLRGQNAPKDVYDPMDTFAANGQHHAVMGVNPPKVEDCTFRMLEPHEIMAGMAFPKEYVMTGNKREQVKQSGNAVTPPAARDLIMIGAESLGVL